jgi:predicted transcriptional regulator
MRERGSCCLELDSNCPNVELKDVTRFLLLPQAGGIKRGPMADKHEFIELTAAIVGAYVANNPVPANSLPELIREVHSKISSLASLTETKEPEPAKPQTPAVNPKKSVHADHIVCLEEGLKFTSLKRHLMTSHGLTPEGYRKKWGLAHDYPMVAPNYSVRRSELAKDSGLAVGPLRPPKIPPRNEAKSGQVSQPL